MTQPIDIFDNISPLSLSTPSPTSSFSDLSLSSTLIDLSLDSNNNLASLAPSSQSSSYSFPSSPSSDSDSLSLPDTSSLSSCTDPTCCPPPHPTTSKTPYFVSEAQFTPLVIVGGGPHSLALAARLSEPRPAALYTDLEHARLSWLNREEVNGEGRKVKAKKKTVKGHWGARKLVSPENVTLAPQAKDEKGIRVLDSTSAQWMGRWDGYFQGLRIKHLRSPMLFHPAPADVDALVAYTQRMGAEEQLEPIHNVVGKELSKHQKKKKRTHRVTGAQPINERDRQDYFRPSTTLFNSFISSELIDRYDLSSLVTHSTVTSISYVPLELEGREEEEPFQGFLVRSTNPDGSTSTWASKAIVVAPGPSNRPNIPEVIQRALPPSTAAVGECCETRPWNEEEIEGENWCHSSAFAIKGFSPLDGKLGDKIRKGLPTTAVVVGGGLTSIQIIDSLLSSGVSHVHLICRSHIKIKHFDFPLTWVDKYNNLSKASFWNSPTYADRLSTIQQARDGGSINPSFHKLLQRYVKTGQVSLKTLSSITRCSSSTSEGWVISGTTQAPSSKREVGLIEPEEWELNGIDYLVSSTGSKVHLDSLPFLNELRTSHPIQEVGGLPCINGDLQWNDKVPLFVMGAYSMLELGPDALNLSGTRTGAERVAHRLGQLGVFETKKRGALGGDEKELGRTRRQDKQFRRGGEGNFFRGLGEVEV